MKYFTLSFLLFSNLAFLSYLRLENVNQDKMREEKLNHLIMQMKYHNDKMAEWIKQAREETDLDYRQWMMEQAILEASKYSECKGVLRYINNGRLP